MLPDQYSAGPPLGRAQLVIGLYGALALLAILLSAGRGDPDPYRLDDDIAARWLLLGPLIGLAIGLALVWATRLLTARYEWARGMHSGFRDILGPLTTRDIVILAAASSIGEELLFRGALLPWIGVWPQALAFALLHVAPGKRLVQFLPWTASAFVVGVGLGYVADATGNLGAPIVAHFTINLLNLRYITKVDLAPGPLDRQALIVPGEAIAQFDLTSRGRK